MPFGYDSTVGWLPVTYPDLLADLKDKYKAETSANIDVEDGPAADMLRTHALILKDAWDDQLGAYNAGFITVAPGSNGVAEGSSLELLLTPKIGPKLDATESTVVLPLFAAPGPDVAVPAGQAVAISGETTPWTLDAPVLIPGGGSINGDFTYSLTGPKTVVAATSWTILTPVSGWTSVGPNAADAIPGRNAETDAEYRARYREALRSNMVAAVRAVDGVTSASINEWQLGSPDPFWGLSHWVEVIIVGGDNTEIAQAIQNTRAKGVNTVGNTLVNLADADYVGGIIPTRFTRPVLVPVYVESTITQGEGYPGDGSTEGIAARESVFKQAVFDYINGLQPGENTSGFRVSTAIANAGIQGIDDVTSKVDIIDPPVNTGTLAADIRDQFTILLVDIDIIGA